LTHT